MRTHIFGYITASCLIPSPVPAHAAGQSSNQAISIQYRFIPADERKPITFDVHEGIVLFRVSVNNTPVWAMLDNRMEGSIVDAGTAPKMGIQLGREASPLILPNGSKKRYSVRSATIEFPGQGTFTLPVSAVDLSFISAAAGRQVGLIVGRDFFSTFEFVLLRAKHELALGPSGSARVPPSLTPIKLRDDRPQVDVDVDGKSLRLTLDFGFNGWVGLQEGAWSRLSSEQAHSVDASSPSTIPGSPTVRWLRQTKIGPIVTLKVPVVKVTAFKEDNDGFVGTGLLMLYNIILDQKAGLLWLAP